MLGALALVAGAGCAGPSGNSPPPASPQASPGPSPTPPAAVCSASGMDPRVAPQAGLPAPVAAMREAIAAAAAACDYARLEELAALNDEPGSQEPLSFSFGQGPGDRASQFWKAEEEAGAGPMAKLRGVLDLPYGEFTSPSPNPATGRPLHLYAWPEISEVDAPSDAHWDALVGVYTPGEVARMKEDAAKFGSGYLGYRAGVSEEGDWMYFVAGD